MTAHIKFPGPFFIFLFLFVQCLSCREEPRDLQSIIAALPPAERIEGISPARNPDAVFCRAGLEGQIKNSIALDPDGQVLMIAEDATGDRLRFSFGVLAQAVEKGRGPAGFYLKVTDGKGLERTVWEASLDPANNPADRGWHEAEVGLELHTRGEMRFLFGARGDDLGAVIANPRVVALHDISRPSIIFILIDALRPDHLSCYGHSRKTSPYIDELSAAGTRFENAITASPFTLTSVASMFSGLYPRDHGVIFTRGLMYPKDVPNLVEVLREEGYTTAAFSGTYFRFSVNGFDRGFDVFDEACAESFFYESADCLAERAGAWLDAHLDEPFFLFLHFVDPHAPYYPPGPYRSAFTEGLSFDHPAVGRGDAGRFGDGRKWYQFPVKPTGKDLEYLKALYDGEVSYVDERIGSMFSDIGIERILEDTIILVSADHGEAFYEHGTMEHRASLYDETLKVPLILAGPGIPRGKVVAEQVRTVDFIPTLFDLAGIPMAKGIEGRSLFPLLQDKGLTPEYALAFRCLSLKKEHYEYAFRDLKEKLILRMPEKTMELYDLSIDPMERNDLYPSEGDRAEALFHEYYPEFGQVEPGRKQN